MTTLRSTPCSSKRELAPAMHALSHDTSAMYMLLESSFARLKAMVDGGSEPPEAGSAALQGQLAHVEACLQEMGRHVQDLAKLARTGAVETRPQRVELSAIVAGVLYEQRELIDERRIAVEVVEPLPACWCHEGRLKQIVTNLVRNAAIHGCASTHAQITISAGMSTPDQQPMVALRIHDNGPGLAARLHEEVFRPGRRFAHQGVPGSGMGLAIVRETAACYGGRAYVDATCPQGTAFVVLLPAAAADTVVAATPEDANFRARGRQWKVQLTGHGPSTAQAGTPKRNQPHRHGSA